MYWRQKRSKTPACQPTGHPGPSSTPTWWRQRWTTLEIYRQLRAGFSEDCNARPSQTRRSGELLKGGKPFYINLIKQIIYSRISYFFVTVLITLETQTSAQSETFHCTFCRTFTVYFLFLLFLLLGIVFSLSFPFENCKTKSINHELYDINLVKQ